jgi:hypothetical protein
VAPQNQEITMMKTRLSSCRWRTAAAATLAAGLLAACGGGGDGYGTPPPPNSCSVADQQSWLSGYMNDWYFWYATHPNPSPAGYSTVDSYFKALLYTGTDVNFPADKWSYITSTAAFNRFFGDGQTLGYGVMVAGLEVANRPDLPLIIRYIEPGSPAAAAGLTRGDQILTINGASAASVITANDYAMLTPNAQGDALALGVRNATGDRTVSLSATVYPLVPVTNPSVVTTAGGRKVGYLSVKDMVSQAQQPADAAFAQFKAAGVQDVVIDLRYNGGGLVAAAAGLASYVNFGNANKTYASLLFNDRHTSSNQTFTFKNYANAAGLSRVYVLTGQRTCSASEQLINGLRPFVNVVTIGDTTCGKPVGFQPQDDGCGSTYSVVNFESVNASNEGRYFNGFDATCPVADDFTTPLGSVTEPLLATALAHADSGACPTASSGPTARALGWKPASQRHLVVEPGDRGGMVLR